MKDIIFTIYKYSISKEKYIEGDMFHGTQKSINCSDLEYFEKKCLGNKGERIVLRELIKKTGKDTSLRRSDVELCEKDEHNAAILEHKDGITIINVQSNKIKMLHDEDFNQIPHDDHPTLLVIIDNRAEHQYIAIQQGVMSTNAVSKILHDTFCHSMLERERYFNVYKLSKHMSFHDTIFHMKERIGKSISKIAFEFDRSEKTNDLPREVSHFLKEWIGRFADEGKIEASISNDDNLKKEDVARDLELLASACMANSRYKLSAWFGNFGVYRYGKDIGAQFGMDTQILSNFINPIEAVPAELDLYTETKQDALPSLENWLDKVTEAFCDYENTQLFPKGRRRHNRKPL